MCLMTSQQWHDDGLVMSTMFEHDKQDSSQNWQVVCSWLYILYLVLKWYLHSFRECWMKIIYLFYLKIVTKSNRTQQPRQLNYSGHKFPHQLVYHHMLPIKPRSLNHNMKLNFRINWQFLPDTILFTLNLQYAFF